MNLGFYDQEHASIPPQVMAARNKIFKIRMPYYIHVGAEHYDAVLAAERFPENTKNAIQECKSEGLEKCIAPFAEMQGTAFLDRSPDYIWTNCHIVYEWMKFAGRDQVFTKSKDVRSYFASLRIPLILSNQEQQIVYGSTEDSYLSAFMTQANFPNMDSACGRQDDLVKIKLNRPLATEGLVWSQTPAQGLLYMGGFPRSTETRQALGKQDSDGLNYFWTFGVSMNFKDPVDLLYLNQKPHMELVLGSSYGSGLLADGVEGMSGSPVLNADGEVLGIYRGFVPLSEEAKDIPFVSLYTNLQGMRFVEIISE